MTLNEYQVFTRTTAIYPSEHPIGLMYAAMGLAGEASEVSEIYPDAGIGHKAGKVLELVKKAVRDHGGHISPERRAAITKELGDLLWYIARVSDECLIPLEHVLIANVEKLSSRKERGVLGGSGDNR